MKGLLLALDTAGDTLSYALHDGQALLAEHSWRAERQPTTQLAPALARALADYGGAVELAALAVSLGPGSYTGLRSGIGLAQGLAEARALPLVGISAHEALLASCRPHPGRLWVAVPAGRGRLYVRGYSASAGHWQEAGPLQKWGGTELQARSEPGDSLLGDWGDAVASGTEAGSAEARPYRYPPAANLRRAGYLAELAWGRLRAAIAAGQEPRLAFPPEAIRPIYAAEEGGV